MIDRFRRRPLYSADNEDTRSELAALEIGADDTVVAICAGGGRALSLLSAAPKRLIAIDKRLDQVFQLELKAAALEAFDHDTLLEFLGVADSRDRLDHYGQIRSALSPSARSYWDRRARLIQAGAYYAGRSDQMLIRLLRIMKSLRLLDWAEPFFCCDTVEAQRVLLEIHRPQIDRGLSWVRVFVNSASIYATTQDPGFLRTTGRSVAETIASRLVQFAEDNLVRDSFLLTMLVRGRLTPWDPLPSWLGREGAARARKNLDRLEIAHGELADFVGRRRAPERLKWSVSDVGCWMSEVAYQQLIRALCLASSAGSRICAREFAAQRSLPAEIRDQPLELRDLAAALSRQDSTALFPLEIVEVAE